MQTHQLLNMECCTIHSNYFQQLSLSQSLWRTYYVLAKARCVFISLALLTSIISYVAWLGLLLMLVPPFNTTTNPPEYVLLHMECFYALLGLGMIVAILIQAVVNGAYVHAVSEIYLQRNVTVGTCITAGVQHIGSLLAGSFLVFIGSLLGFVCLFIPGIFLWFQWLLIHPIIMVEGLSAVEAMKRSWTLVTGSWGYVCCTYMIIVSLWTAFIVPCMHVFMTNPLEWIILLIPFIFLGYFPNILITIMYINLRVEKEGLSAELFACDGGGGATNEECNFITLIIQVQSDPKRPDPFSVV